MCFSNIHRRATFPLSESVSSEWERWWRRSYAKFLKNQKTAYVALSSWPDLVGRGVFGAYSEVVVTLLVTDRDFQVFDKVSVR